MRRDPVRAKVILTWTSWDIRAGDGAGSSPGVGEYQNFRPGWGFSPAICRSPAYSRFPSRRGSA